MSVRCCFNVNIIKSYLHAYISRIFISKVIRILCIQRRWLEYFVFDKGDYDIVVFWGDDLDRDRYHMHIESCLGALHNLTNVILAYVLGEYWHWWNIRELYTWWNFGEYVKMWKCTCVLLYLYAWWLLKFLSYLIIWI